MTTDQPYQARHGKTTEPDPGPATTGTAPAEDRAAWTQGQEAEQPRTPDQPTTGGQQPKEPRSTPASIERLSKEGLQQAAEHAFVGIGTGLNGVCAEDRGVYEEPDDIWIPTEDEAEGVGQPTGRLLARRLPDIPGGDASDAADIVALAIPLGIWLIRGLSQWLPRLGRKRRATIKAGRAEPEQAEQ